MSSVIKDLHNSSIDLESEDFALSEGLRRALEAFMAQETKQPKPSSSAEIWEYLSNQYGSQFNPPLREDYLQTIRSLPEDITPAYLLPCSLHASSTLSAWQWMDVFGDKGNPRVKKLRLLRPVCSFNPSCLLGLIPGSISISFLSLRFFVAARSTRQRNQCWSRSEAGSTMK